MLKTGLQDNILCYSCLREDFDNLLIADPSHFVHIHIDSYVSIKGGIWHCSTSSVSIFTSCHIILAIKSPRITVLYYTTTTYIKRIPHGLMNWEKPPKWLKEENKPSSNIRRCLTKVLSKQKKSQYLLVLISELTNNAIKRLGEVCTCSDQSTWILICCL